MIASRLKSHPIPNAALDADVAILGKKGRGKPASPPKEITAATLSQLGGAILAARTAAGLSQHELAARLQTPQPNIARLENGRSIPSTNTLQRIAKATGHELVITFRKEP